MLNKYSSKRKNALGMIIGFTIISGVMMRRTAHANHAELSWCDSTLCSDGHSHIACGNTGEFAANCVPDSVEIDISKYQPQILHEHNRRRNFLALGQLPGYYPAARMATMSWDSELAYLASLNVRTCALEHDECHNTYRYKSAGQNLASVFRDRDHRVNITSLFEETVRLWFRENVNIDSSYIDNFRVTKNFQNYGHFVQMSVDRNTHVGCAVLRFTRPDFPSVYIYNIACNYASVYAFGVPIYAIGHPATTCKTGSNPHYPGLCSVKEPFNPNYY